MLNFPTALFTTALIDHSTRVRRAKEELPTSKTSYYRSLPLWSEWFEELKGDYNTADRICRSLELYVGHLFTLLNADQYQVSSTFKFSEPSDGFKPIQFSRSQTDFDVHFEYQIPPQKPRPPALLAHTTGIFNKTSFILVSTLMRIGALPVGF
jgi:hypothetical protein